MPDPIDIHVGRRIRARRVLCGLSQTALGEAIGITFQQMQKYESGANRVSASRLWRCARALDCPVEYFFDGQDDAEPDARPVPDLAPATQPASVDTSSARENLELLRCYAGIADPALRTTLRTLMRRIALLDAVEQQAGDMLTASELLAHHARAA